MTLVKVKLRGTENVGGVNRNLIINGAMQVAQRGTSSTTGNYTTVDRWRLNYGGGGTLTQAQHTLSSSDTPYTLGFRKSYHATVTGASNAAGTFSQLEQHIEAQNIAESGWNYTSSSSKLTLSFWVKSSLAGTYYNQFRTIDGTSYYYNKTFTLAANTWKKITCTIPGNSNLQVDDNNGHGFTVIVCPDYGTTYTGHAQAVTDAWYNRTENSGYFPNFAQDWSNTANATFEITAVQLEVGDEATDFEHHSFAEELRICQRYFCKSADYSVSPDHNTDNHSICVLVDMASNLMRSEKLFFPVKMRAAPTVTQLRGGVGFSSSNGQWAWYQSGSWTYYAFNSGNLTEDGFSAHGSVAGAGDGNAYWTHIAWKAEAEV